MRTLRPSFVVQNISNKDVSALGMRIKPNRKVDLFSAIVGLTEDRVVSAMARPNGELHKKIEVFRTLRLTATNLVMLENAADTAAKKDAVVSNSVSVVRSNLENEKDKTLRTAYDNKTQRYSDLHYRNSMAAAMSGDMMLSLSDTSDGYVQASLLNDGYSTAVNSVCAVIFKMASKTLSHIWANFDVTVSITTYFNDGNIEDPTVVLQTLEKGKGIVKIRYDKGNGTYQAGDYVEVQVKISSDDKILGYTVLPITKTFKVI